MANAITKISKRAKEIRRNKPGMTWSACIKQASKDYKAGTITGVKKKAAPRKAAPRKKAAASKPKSTAPVKRAAGPARGVTLSGVRSSGVALLNEKYGKLATQKLHEKTKRGKAQLQKQMAGIASQLRKIKSL